MVCCITDAYICTNKNCQVHEFSLLHYGCIYTQTKYFLVMNFHYYFSSMKKMQLTEICDCTVFLEFLYCPMIGWLKLWCLNFFFEKIKLILYLWSLNAISVVNIAIFYFAIFLVHYYYLKILVCFFTYLLH